MKKAWAFILCLVIVVLAANIAVSLISFGTVNSLSGRLESQEKSNKELQSQLDKLQNQYTTLQEQITKVQATKASYKEGKVAFLTFDDGPSEYTPQLLDTLKANGVHATFFVVGTNLANKEQTVKRAHDEGNVVGIHCWNHSYPVCYASQDAFMEDFNHIKSALTNILGVSPNVCRFPGGTGNTVSDKSAPHFMQLVLPKVTTLGVKPYDWNVDAGDAEGAPKSSQQVISTVVNNAKKFNNPVILCHDTKKTTVEAIPTVISQLKAAGYTFAVLSPIAPTCQQKAV